MCGVDVYILVFVITYRYTFITLYNELSKSPTGSYVSFMLLW